MCNKNDRCSLIYCTHIRAITNLLGNPIARHHLQGNPIAYLGCLCTITTPVLSPSRSLSRMLCSTTSSSVPAQKSCKSCHCQIGMLSYVSCPESRCLASILPVLRFALARRMAVLASSSVAVRPDCLCLVPALRLVLGTPS